MRKLVMAALFAFVFGSLMFGVAAQAAPSFTTLTLPALNMNISTWSDGSTYNSVFPGLRTWNGVPFKLEVEENTGNNVFYNGTLTIPVNVYGATNAYTLINSYCGEYGTVIGKVEFNGSDGAYYSADLEEGRNVRDHFAGGYNNIIDGTNAVAAFDNGNGRARLDMQIYWLPADFSDETLTNIVFTAYDKGRSGIPFIAAATVEVNPVPVPPSVLLLGSGLVGLGALSRRKLRFRELFK